MTSRKESERTKLVQEKCQTLLTQMLRDEDNKYCVDCDAKGPRWASWNLGVFLCIRCAGIHRNLGVHISRVKSVNLDTWTPEQVISLQQMGNSRARAVYEAQLPDGFRRPQTDTALESFIRAKYEQKKYLAREWVPPALPKVDWAKEIDEELEKQKRKKKAAQATSVFGIGVGSGATAVDKKSTISSKSSPIPEPLAKPKSQHPHSGSPKARPIVASVDSNSHTNDLLGLSSPTRPLPQLNRNVDVDDQNMQNNFGGFLSASPTGDTLEKKPDAGAASHKSAQNLLVKEEEDFFNQGSLGASATNSDKDKSQKLTKDSILALYGTGGNVNANTYAMQMNFGQTLPMFNASNVAPGYMNAPHPQQQQFMTPPNSTSMYNAPVMTAPTAFSAPGMGSVHMGAFSGQFPVQSLSNVGVGFPQQQQQLVSNAGLMGVVGKQPGQATNNASAYIPAANPAFGGLGQHPQMGGAGMSMMSTADTTMGSSLSSAFPPPSATAGVNLNQQFGNLNIGNVWQ